MINHHDQGTVAVALVQSVGHAAATPREAHHAHDEVLDVLRTAQVELYCDHESAAMAAVREARKGLDTHTAQDSLALADLEEAAWHLRHHHADEALNAIGRARKTLA